MSIHIYTTTVIKEEVELERRQMDGVGRVEMMSSSDRELIIS